MKPLLLTLLALNIAILGTAEGQEAAKATNDLAFSLNRQDVMEHVCLGEGKDAVTFQYDRYPGVIRNQFQGNDYVKLYDGPVPDPQQGVWIKSQDLGKT